MVKPRAFVYIDGFNLYYGALKGTHEKWLDLQAWCALLLPQHDVRGIVYCTARVTSRPDDPDSHVRQDAYLRALGTLSAVSVLEGTFKVSKTRMRRVSSATCPCCALSPAGCQCCRANTVEVTKTEEKGSDVHLSVRLVADGYADRYDEALVVSNDSDIQPAVDIVRSDLGKRVIVANPRNTKHPALIGDERRRVGRPALERSQLPTVVLDAAGRQITRPHRWS